MKISLNWLKEYVDIKITAEELAEKLTLAGLAVESIEKIADKYQQMVVAEILAIQPHPNADKLRLVDVKDSSGTRQVVCGAPNIEVGQKVPLALPGARLAGDVEIKATEIRGQQSAGMLCSSRELGLGDEHAGILILERSVRLSDRLVDALGIDDVILDFDLTPNRGDCFSVRGIAREASAILSSKLKVKSEKLRLKIKNDDHVLKIQIADQKMCSKYCAIIIKGVKIKESPEWLKNRLKASDVRPINNVVDITNYVMLELGEPLHAFDLTRIRGEESGVRSRELGVRAAKDGEEITCLDGQTRILDEQMIVITDGQEPIALAGVMGGATSEVSSTTTDIVLEAAIFNPAAIRHAYRHLGLRTEAAIRFEKGIDWQAPEQALSLAAELFKEFADAEDISDIYRQASPDPTPAVVNIRPADINKLLGTDLSADKIKQILQSLKFEITSQSADAWQVQAPSWRLDINIPADLAEEVGRIYDYNNIMPAPIQGAWTMPPASRDFRFKQRLQELMAALGYNEIYTYSFCGDEDIQFTGQPAVELANPMNQAESFLRTSLEPWILRKAAKNLRFFGDIKIFELGTVFQPSAAELPGEETHLCGAIARKTQSGEHLYRELKGDLESIFKTFNITDIIWQSDAAGVNIQRLGQSVGQLKVLSPEAVTLFKIRQSIAIFSLNIKLLASNSQSGQTYQALPTYPGVVRDLSFLTTRSVQFGDISSAARQISPLILAVDLADEYQLQAGRGLTLRFTYQSAEKTLTHEEVSDIEQQVIKALMTDFDLKLRS